jgi:uncharacterized spore protein YtfJ
MNRLRATVVDLEAMRLIVIESIETGSYRTGDNGFCYGTLEPIAVVTCDSKRIRAVDMQGHPVSVDDLTDAVPRLAELISDE